MSLECVSRGRTSPVHIMHHHTLSKMQITDRKKGDSQTSTTNSRAQMAIAMTAGGAAAAVFVARAGANLPIGVNNSQPIHGFLPVDLGFQERVKE